MVPVYHAPFESRVTARTLKAYGDELVAIAIENCKISYLGIAQSKLSEAADAYRRAAQNTVGYRQSEKLELAAVQADDWAQTLTRRIETDGERRNFSARRAAGLTS
ncbi:MAG TPA: hypothetical protein VFR09_09595 [Alphaproteobacteria bacterium]|nr:hypothetical protein [Alphaproteobacteria bacterium]